MSRPAVSVVMPFAGSRAEASAALAALTALAVGPDDELILVDNSGTAPPNDAVIVAPARAERSPAHARNVGAARAAREWVLFLDADCRAPAGLIDSYFCEPIAADVGALAGAIDPDPEGTGLAARYGAAKSFLDHEAHLAHPYMPRAAAANLLVRRVAFDQIGGFLEGVAAGEDTDFSWRLQRAGWRLEAQPRARVEHRYRSTVGALRRQWRGYAAGRAWLSRRYHGFTPEPALTRALRRGPPGARATPARDSGSREPLERGPLERGRLEHRWLERGRFLALDAVLGVEELAGFTLSNRPPRPAAAPARVVLVADRFPIRGDPLADFARSLAGARVEAQARPESVDPEAVPALTVDYREDDGVATRVLALLRLVTRHPLRSALDRGRRRAGEPGLAAIAPAVLRLARDAGARVHPLGGDDARAVAARLAALASRGLES